MKYAHILAAFVSDVWAIEPQKLETIVDFLALQIDGEKFDAEEIEARIAPQRAAAVARQEGDVAILPLRGVIANRMNMMSSISGGTSSEGFSRMFNAARADDSVKAIVLDVDSPGGNAQGADELAAEIFAARGTKPIIAQVNAQAASAAYWIASAADEIVVNPTAEVGAIGVYTVHSDMTSALEKLGVTKTVISAGRYKAEGLTSLSDEAKAHIQGRVDAFYGMFVGRVAKGRGVSAAAVRGGFGEGRMVGAQAAVAEGMADRIATMSETLQRFGAAPASPGKRAFASNREKRALLID
ncbi:S49 family peptidase [Jiella pelagia]|uniref:S49 family peptidase n=1 Tax=Jiella pelagia TaxID=2986949 RepID=A0ABY7C070_9HYPH|nr:S49 family peptidase [Jiella pelagia]WAP67220.1 S49 family peptidase [Jiella pelagia]